MAERLLEYNAMLRLDLLRAGTTRGRRERSVPPAPASVSIVVYTGRRRWMSPMSVEERTLWAPPELARWQPRFAVRRLDAQTFAGDDARDGNLARAWLALEAASLGYLPSAAGRVGQLLDESGDLDLTRSFDVWGDGVLVPRFGEKAPSFVNMLEKPTMLAETLKDWEERKLAEGVELGRAEGVALGRARECSLLREIAERRFGVAAGAEVSRLLTKVDGQEQVATIAALIVDCEDGPQLIRGLRALPRNPSS